MHDFILDIEVKVTAKPVNAKVGTTQRGPYERNLFVVRESVKTAFSGNKGDIALMVADAVKPISRQWPLGVTPPTINTISGASPLAATTATINANVTDGAVAVASGDLSLDVVATAGTITRASGSFLDDGFRPGMTIDTTGFTNAGNNSDFIIDTVTDLVITVVDNTGMVNETGGGNENVDATTTGVFIEYGSAKDVLDTVVQADESPLSGLTATDVDFSLTGLTAETQYYYRVAIVAGGLTVRSQMKTFTTPAA